MFFCRPERHRIGPEPRNQTYNPALMTRIRLRTLTWVVPAVVVLGWLALRPSPNADGAPRRVVPVDAQLDLGPYETAALREYRVRPGDTLGHIAQREVGSVRHVSALRRWNPTVKATALRVGQTLRLPPSDRAASDRAASDQAEGPEPRAFFAWRLDALGRGHLECVSPHTRLRDMKHGFVLLAAPLSQVAHAEREWRDAEAFSAPLPRVPGTASSGVLARAHEVSEHDLTERILQTVVVESIVGNTIRTARSAQRLDGKGRTIPPISVHSNEWSTLLLTVLGALGAALLLFVGARRLELAHE